MIMRPQMEIREEEKLNIILMYADNWRYDTLSAAGNAIVQTPNLDRLADEGTLSTHNDITKSVCWISQATLCTGQNLSRHKAFRGVERGDIPFYDK
jgi:arylsulfatase